MLGLEEARAEAWPEGKRATPVMTTREVGWRGEGRISDENELPRQEVLRLIVRSSRPSPKSRKIPP